MMLYLECKSGISGDMFVASLLDLGVDQEVFRKAINSLNLEGVDFEISRLNTNGIMACDFDVKLYEHEHHHCYEHDHKHHHHHEHRNLKDVFEVIDKGDLTPKTKALAKKIFTVVAEAEAKVHGRDINEVHFHEVGALDSIVDIVGAAVCIDYLKVNEVVVSALSEGSGFVECQHGRLPVPVPATVEIASKYGIKLNITESPYEMVTPTGIAIVAALKTHDKLPSKFKIEKTGYGAGKRKLEHPNILRSLIVEKTSDQTGTKYEDIYVLETNIDDSTGEQLGFTMEELFKAGAKDVHYVPAFMKKNRPGWLLRIVAKESDIPKLEEIVFCTTTTIGIRRFKFDRSFLKRELITVNLPYGEAVVKKCYFKDKIFYYPEYESVKKLFLKTGMAFSDLINEIKQAAEKEI